MPLQNLKDATDTLAKAYGKAVGGKGFKYPQFQRLRTGIFTLDVSLGGGIPLGAVSLLYGNESSGKTSLALRCAAEFQRKFPKRAVCWIDIETSWDDELAMQYGVDPKKVWLFKPTTAEEAADIAKELSMSEDAGLLVVDSLAALSSIQQLEKSAEQVVVAGAAKPSTQLLRNVGAGITEHNKAGQLLTAIYINQPRMKIGFVMGNPEFLPGPVLQNFQAFLKLRLSAKPVLKEKIAPIPLYNDTSAKIVKRKFPAIRQTSAWQMALYPYDGGTKTQPVHMKRWDINNRHHIKKTYLENDWITKHDNGWLLHATGELFGKQEEAVDALCEDYDMAVEFAVNELLKVFEDEIKDFYTDKADMSG